MWQSPACNLNKGCSQPEAVVVPAATPATKHAFALSQKNPCQIYALTNRQLPSQAKKSRQTGIDGSRPVVLFVDTGNMICRQSFETSNTPSPKLLPTVRTSKSQNPKHATVNPWSQENTSASGAAVTRGAASTDAQVGARIGWQQPYTYAIAQKRERSKRHSKLIHSHERKCVLQTPAC